MQVASTGHPSLISSSPSYDPPSADRNTQGSSQSDSHIYDSALPSPLAPVGASEFLVNPFLYLKNRPSWGGAKRKVSACPSMLAVGYQPWLRSQGFSRFRFFPQTSQVETSPSRPLR